jgi:hypothetical protein
MVVDGTQQLMDRSPAGAEPILKRLPYENYWRDGDALFRIAHSALAGCACKSVRPTNRIERRQRGRHASNLPGRSTAEIGVASLLRVKTEMDFFRQGGGDRHRA